jgi:hypothetical protein
LTTIVAAGLLLVSPGVVLGVTTVTIGNNDPSFDGTYYGEHNISCRQTAAYRTESLWK